MPATYADPAADHYESRPEINKTVDWIARGARMNASWLDSIMCADNFTGLAGTAPLDVEPRHIFQNVAALIADYIEREDGDDDWDDLFSARLHEFCAGTPAAAVPSEDLQDTRTPYWTY